LEKDGDEFDVRTGGGEVIEAAFEFADLGAEVSFAFGENDDRTFGAHGIQDLRDGIVRNGNFFALDEECVENIAGEIAAEGIAGPVIVRGDGASDLADGGREAGPEDERVEVTGVIGKINALLRLGCATDPVRAAGAGDEAGEKGESVIQHGRRTRARLGIRIAYTGEGQAAN
jgi:hypothetical protein